MIFQAMDSKLALFLLFIASQLVVFIFYQFDAVDGIVNIVHKSRDRWTNSSGIYDFLMTTKTHESDNLNEEGFLSSLGDTMTDVKDWFSSVLSEQLVFMPPPSYLTNGDVRDKAFAPQIREQVFLLILITSHPKASSRRERIRRTWAGSIDSKRNGKPGKSTNIGHASTKNVYCVFTVGFVNDVHLDHHLETEYYRYGDIIRVDSKETYRTLVNKIWGSFGWAISVHPKYVLKADDDVYVNIPKFVSWLQNPKLPRKLYAGFIHYRGYVYRDHGSRWFVSRAQFPGSHFPNYCAGPFYVFSGNMLKKLFENSQKFKKFQVEDAYFGLIAKSIGLVPYHAGRAFLLDHNLHQTLSRIPDSRFQELCVLGHGLHEQEIDYIYQRYVKIAAKENKKKGIF